jgi:hypothetical protein
MTNTCGEQSRSHKHDAAPGAGIVPRQHQPQSRGCQVCGRSGYRIDAANGKRRGASLGALPIFVAIDYLVVREEP